ncbi:MAG: YHYH protein [bacterium]
MKLKIIGFLVLAFASTCQAQLGPDVTSWILNTTGKTGYGGLLTNIQQVQYSADNVYVSASCVPGYNIGPWPGNPNTPRAQNFVYKITRHPQANTGVLVATPLGHIGVWSNGVSVFNAKDAMSYQNADVWHQNAIVVEGSSFDNCLGHPAPNGEYHHHLNPRCLYDSKDSSKHSPIIGYSFDGFPIYGAYGFAKTDGTGGITRMRSSYRMRNITDRTTLADGTVLTSTKYGPSIATKALGYYIEDFEYIKDLGDLDEHNGRNCITPEYPAGTYAYFVTLDETGTAVYPYTLGLTYYGTIPAGNIGPNGGHNSVSETVTTYIPNGVAESQDKFHFAIYPNPSSYYTTIIIDPSSHNNVHLRITDVWGSDVFTADNLQPAVPLTIDVSKFASGEYFVTLTDSREALVQRMIVKK